MSSLWCPCPGGLGTRRQVWLCFVFLLLVLFSAKVSAYADVITVLESYLLDIKAEKKAVERYDQIAGANINFDKSRGLQLGAWRGGVPLPEPFCWSDGPICILGV